MTVPIVSTYSVIQKTINDVARVQSSLFDAQTQLSSGQRSQDFKGMANDAIEYLSLDAALGKAAQYQADNRIIETRLNSTSNALSNVVTTANTLKNLIAQRRSGVSGSEAFQNQLEGLWRQFTSDLNTQVNNQFLFSGSRTNTAAVDTQTFPSLAVESVPDASYYRGSQQNVTAIIKDNTPITYNIRADASGFQKIFAGLATASEGGIANSDLQLAEAFDFVAEGIDEVIGLQAIVNANRVQLITTNDSLKNQELYFRGIQEEIGNTDIIGVSTRLAVDQGVLQAAFQAFAKISSLRLSDFLR